MSIWGKLFGSEKVIDAGISGVDKMFYTDEEKSDAKMLFLRLYEPYKIAQRWLMTFVCMPYMLLWFITGCILIADVFIMRDLNTAKITNFLLHQYVGTSFVVIITFYFGGGAVEGIVDRFKAKKDK